MAAMAASLLSPVCSHSDAITHTHSGGDTHAASGTRDFDRIQRMPATWGTQHYKARVNIGRATPGGYLLHPWQYHRQHPNRAQHLCSNFTQSTQRGGCPGACINVRSTCQRRSAVLSTMPGVCETLATTAGISCVAAISVWCSATKRSTVRGSDVDPIGLQTSTTARHLISYPTIAHQNTCDCEGLIHIAPWETRN